MKILFIDHPENDYLAAIIFLGLCQEFGEDNVVDWPYKESYHGKIHTYSSFYTGNVDGTTIPFKWMIPQNTKKLDDQEIFDQIKSFDLVILASPRIGNIDALRRLIAVVGRESINKLIMMDGEDSDSIRNDVIEEFKPSLYFKREMFVEHKNLQCPILPCSFASPMSEFSLVKKNIDVINLGGGNYFTGIGRYLNLGINTKAELDEALNKSFNNILTGFVENYDKYLDSLNKAKIGIALGGWGFDTLRIWEVPSFKETLLVMNRTLQIIPNMFIDGEHCIMFSTFDELVTVLNKYLDDDDERIRIATAGNKLLRKYHTVKARARYIVEESLKV